MIEILQNKSVSLSTHLQRIQTSTTMAATITARVSTEGRAVVSRACDRSGEILGSELEKSLGSVISLAPVLKIHNTMCTQNQTHACRVQAVVLPCLKRLEMQTNVGTGL